MVADWDGERAADLEAGEEHPAHWLASSGRSERYVPKHSANAAAAVSTGTEPSC